MWVECSRCGEEIPGISKAKKQDKEPCYCLECIDILVKAGEIYERLARGETYKGFALYTVLKEDRRKPKSVA